MLFKRFRAAKIPWGGSLREMTLRQRLMWLCILCIASISLTFSQVAFLPVSIPPFAPFYVVTLMVPLTLAALTLGVAGGAIVGFLCGTILFLHAAFLPLNVFEEEMVRASLTIANFEITGLLLGILFPIVLASGAKRWRKLLRYAMVCLFVSVVFSFMFMLNVMLQTLIESAEVVDSGVAFTEKTATIFIYSRINAVGHPGYQMFFDTILMIASCWLSDVALGIIGSDRDARPLHLTFNMGLFVTVLIAFMTVTAVVTVAETEREKELTHRKLIEECEYLDIQRVEQERRGALYTQSTLQSNVSSADAGDVFKEHFSTSTLLEGYGKSTDGIVIIAHGSGRRARIVATDDKLIKIGEALEDELDVAVMNAISRSLSDNSLQSAIYDRYHLATEDFGTSQLGYLVAVSSTKSGIPDAHDYTDQTGGYIYIMLLPSEMVFADRGEVVRWVSQTAFVLMAVVYILVSRLLGQTVVSPMLRMGEELDEICDGKLDTVVDARGSTEFTSLSAGINTTVEALKEWIAEAERRIEKELETARAIQLSALPSVFPAFPDISEFDLYASMHAAREVGGDFYDFFLIGEDTVAFLVADVSGKGIPASLFMMSAKANLDNYLSSGMDLADAVSATNVRLCEGNEAEMFVTTWVATLDYKRGELSFVNAGHNPPLLRHNGRWSWITQKCGIFMGSFAQAKYRSSELVLVPGDLLLLYTDGVNEAFNVNDEQYGNDRLESFLAAHADLGPKEIVEALKADVASWSEGAVQSDDITIFALEYHG